MLGTRRGVQQWITLNYREAYNFRASNGILFNHDSPVHGETFLIRRITLAVARHYLYEAANELLTTVRSPSAGASS